MVKEELIDKCKRLLKEEKYSEIIKICNQILELDPENDIALHFNGISNYHLQNYEESIKYLEKACINNPTDDKIIMDYGSVLYEVGKLDEALTLYDFYFSSEDKTRKNEVEEYFITLAKKCLDKNKTKDAIKCYDYYLDKRLDSSRILHLKIHSLSHLKRFDDALSSYESLVTLTEGGKLYSRSCIDHVLCLEAKAFYLYDKGFLEKSKETFSLASEHYMKEYNMNLYDLTPWHKHLSNALTISGNSCEEFFKNFFIVDAEDSMNWCDLIYYFTNRYYSYGNLDIMICDWLLEKNPNAIPILNKKAVLHQHWKPTTSLKLYEKILEIDETNTEAIKGKLNMLIQLKWYGKLSKYIKTLPSNINSVSDEIMNIAEVLSDNKKYAEAIECYEKVLEFEPFEISAITNIRKIWEKGKMKDDKEKSKYYMDWLDVILSYTNYSWCSEEGCEYQRLSHIVHGINGHVLMEKPQSERDYIIKGSVDCDDDATHYCPKCKKIYKLDIEGFDYNKEDLVLFEYATTLILSLKHYLQDGFYGKNLNNVQERFHDEYCIDKREFNAFISKLEKLGYVNRNVVLNLC